jgi:hypothetical protein
MTKKNNIISFVTALLVLASLFHLLGSKAADKSPDINNDGQVNILDLSNLLSNWNQTGANTADINNDNTVNILDLSILLSKWGTVAAQAPVFFDTADWLWQKIPANPVLDPNSATWASYYAAATTNKVIDTYYYGTPIYYTHDANGNRRPGAYKNVTATHTEWGTNPFAAYNPVWIPDDAAPSPRSDAAMVIVDSSRNLTFEFWEARKDSQGNWIMGWGGVLCYHGRGNRNTGGCETNQHGAVGSGMSRLAGLITREDIARGSINHAMVFATNIAKPVEFRYPATKTDGRNLAGVATPIPEGARIQLDPAADISGLTGYQRMVAEALKTYGAYVIDNGGAPTPIGGLALIAEGQDPAGPKNGTPYFSPTTPVPGNPVYPGSTFYNAGMRDTGDGYQSLSGIPWNKVRVLKNWNGL